MSPDEPTGYEDEPREIFEPLPAHLHSTYYHHERLSGSPQPEFEFYGSVFKNRCSRLLELGCGTSLVSGYLADQGFSVTGIDLSRSMLEYQPNPAGVEKVQMDMRTLGFRPCFDGALIPHNTLNLLVDREQIKQCLAEIKRVLLPPGILALQLYAAEEYAHDDKKRSLQFLIYDLPGGDKIVKESITGRDPLNAVLNVEQRYKYRNFSRPELNCNYRQILQLASFSSEQWLSLLNESGFTPIESLSRFSGTPKQSNTVLIVTARAY